MDRLSRTPALGPSWNAGAPGDLLPLIRARRAARALRFGWWLALSAPLVFALIAVGLGKEAGWDFQNYHWYDPFALLDGRLGVDIAPAHHATYYNPLSDLPSYWLATHAPAWTVGLCLGALFGVVVALIGAIAYRLVAIRDPYWRIWTAAGLAVAGALGGGAFPAIGNTSNDVPVAIGVFAALLLLLKHYAASAPRAGERSNALVMFMLAGVCVGAAAGLKLTVMMYALGLSAAVLFCDTGFWRARLVRWVGFNCGIAAGFLLCDGYWMLRLWKFGANPFFPYFNGVFHSPLLIDGSYRDPSFLPGDWLSAWLFPFYFTVDSHRVAEWDFRDAHIAVLYLIVPFTALLMWRKRAYAQGPIAPRAAAFLFVFASVSYFGWLMMFGVYRYLIPLEMLAPLLIAAAMLLWPLPPTRQVVAIIALLACLQLVVKFEIKRLPWTGAYVDVAAPPLTNAKRSMILLTGIAPMAYVIPAFPREVPFVRIDGWLVPKDQTDSGLARYMHDRVASHTGPLYILFSPAEDQRAVEAARAYGLQFGVNDCDLVRSNVAAPLKLCRVSRSS